MHTSRRDFLQTAVMTSAAAGIGTLGRTAHAAASAQIDPAPKSLNLLILGGTSFLGPAIIEYATARGHTMTMFNRGKTNPDLFPDVKRLVGDRDKNELDALKGQKFDAVIDTCGYVPAHVTDAATILAEHAAQYVFISSVSALGSHAIPYADETAPVGEITDEQNAEVTKISDRGVGMYYGPLKARCEAAAEAAMPGRTTNIRPGLIVGPRDRTDRFGYWPVRIKRGGEVLAPGDGTDPIQIIDVRDLGDWAVRCIEEQHFGVYHAITPPNRFNMAEMLYGIKGAFTTDAAFTWASTEFVTGQGLQPWAHMPVWIPPQDGYEGFHLVSVQKAVDAGLTFRPLADTAQATVAWQESTRPADYDFGNPDFRSRGGLSRAREAEVLKAWHALQAEEKTKIDTPAVDESSA